MKKIESQQEELHRAQAEELHRRDQQLLHKQLLKQNLDLREAHEKSLNEMEELTRFQGSIFDTFSRSREPEVPEAGVPVVVCLDGLARITSKELAITHFCEKWHPPECLFYKTKSGCRFGEKLLIRTSSGW